MKTVMFIALLAIAGCSQQPHLVAANQFITLNPNQTLATRNADELTCRDNTHLVCREVLGARIESPLKDCSCIAN